jgi:hypothetical protein
MAYKHKTWQEKLHTGAKPKVKNVESTFADIPAGSSMLIATPEIVDNYINHIPVGAHTSLQQMRNDLAAEYHAQYTCPVTSGIFLRIAAEAAYEAYAAGRQIEKITPFWRMIDSKSPTSKKLTFGTAFVKVQRAKEGLPF